MKIVYIAKDGTKFNNIFECFNYEWREFFPNVKAFDMTDRLTSDMENAITIRIHNPEEYEFVREYLREICDLEFISGCYLDNECNGVIAHCEDEPEFIDESDVCTELDLFAEDGSDLVLEFKDYLSELLEVEED